MIKRALKYSGICLALCTGLKAVAQSVVDPTRPPSYVGGDQTMSSDHAGSDLQSVLIAPGRTHAFINGRPVKVGDQIGDAKIVKIEESQVVLRHGKEIQVLKLFPSVEKRLTSHRSGAKVDSR